VAEWQEDDLMTCGIMGAGKVGHAFARQYELDLPMAAPTKIPMVLLPAISPMSPPIFLNSL
jgi:hypothetical protein